ncbi:MAG: type VI secretion system Vgr family protein [Gemmataceae bacterium]
MSTFTQADRSLSVATPLGPDAFLLERLVGHEGVSTLFRFQLDLLADANTSIPFHKVLGQKMIVTLKHAHGKNRHFSGICSELRQGAIVRGDLGNPELIRYHAELVPPLWLLTRRVQSRIFQQQSVPDILKTVLKGLEVRFTLTASYRARNYCVQYRESDFAFASRLMEEEGIYYFFEHQSDGESLVISDLNLSHPHLPAPHAELDFDDAEALGKVETVSRWEKAQQVAPTRFVVRDRHFEVPQATLEGKSNMQPHVKVGAIDHALDLDGFGNLEVYQHPGDFAHRFDGIAPGGAEQPGQLQPLFQENISLAQLLMEREASHSLRIEGASNCPALTPGYLFSLKKHPQAQGEYMLTRVEHEVSLPGYRSGGHESLSYGNRFQCLPKELKYRPANVTPRPTVHGTQTATVSGPTAGEIYTDKYGRIKVKFAWDREAEAATDTSCWIRVMQPWAGQGWGSISLPRVGQEVVVDFLDGNPDRPLILGSVYNSEQMPPYALPGERMVSGLRSRSLLSTNAEHYNELAMDDTAGQEKLSLTAQKDMNTTVENDYTLTVDNNSTVTIKNKSDTTVHNNTTWTFGNSPLTMNFVATWNNIEINKLTKTVVSSVSHADVTAMNVNVDGLRFTGVATLHAEIDLLKYEKVFTKSFESCGAKSLSTSYNLTEKIGRDHNVSVAGKSNLTVKKDLNIKGKVVDINTSVPGTNPNDQMMTVRSKNEVNVGGGNKVNITCGGEEADPIGIFMDKSGKLTIQAQNLVLQAKNSIVLRSPTVAIQGKSDEMPYDEVAYELVENMLENPGIRASDILDALERSKIDEEIVGVLSKFYGLG